MGQFISKSKPQDLPLSLEISSLDIIILTLSPIYVFGEDPEYESNLSTGNSDLDLIVTNRISDLEAYVTRLLPENLDYEVLATVMDSDKNQIYLTLTKPSSNQKEMDFNQQDCQRIRDFIDYYNQQPNNPILLNAEEAHNSLFLDDLGDLRLGFQVVNAMEYL